MIKFFFITTLVLLSIGINAQELKIFVYDSLNELPIPFANISVGNKKMMTDYKGYFENDFIKTDEAIVVECSGYYPQTLKTSVFADTVFLKKKEIYLEEVTITRNENVKLISLGNTDEKTVSTYKGLRNLSYKDEVTFYLSLKIKEATHQGKIIKNIKYKISENPKSNLCYIRPHLYVLGDENKLEEVELDNIVIPISGKNKIYSIDIGSYNIPFSENGMLIGVEVLGDSEFINIGMAKSDENKSFGILNNNKNYNIIPLNMELKNKTGNFQMGLDLYDE